MMAVLLMLVLSRVTELIAVPGLVFGLNMILLGYAWLTGRGYQTLFNPATVLLLSLTAWMGFSALFGMYRYGSLTLLAATWCRSVLIYLAVVALVLSLATFRLVTTAVTLACATIVLLSRFLGALTPEEGRLVVLTSTLSNPNDLAMLILLGLPFTAFVIFDRQRRPVMRFIALATLLGSVHVVFLTGSRSALIALAFLLFLLLAFVQKRARLLLILAAVVGTLLAALLLPDPIRRRYQTLVKDEVEEVPDMRVVAFAEGSELQRWYLLKTSLVITMHHPLFGVGPGNFADAHALMLRELLLSAPWRQTHNSYTQVSSECGLPAAGMYLLLLGLCLKTTLRIRKAATTVPEFAHFAGPSLCLLASTLCYAVVAMFSSIAYLPYFPMLAGLTIGLRAAARRQLQSMPQSGPPHTHRRPALVL
jgi:O-antigen ligase